jgi:hypothetical protein
MESYVGAFKKHAKKDVIPTCYKFFYNAMQICNCA